MKRKALIIIIIAALAVLWIVRQTFFFVDMTEHVIVTQFGKPVEVYLNLPIQGRSVAGLKRKLPFLQRLYRLDNRLRVYEATDAAFLTVDKTEIVISFYTLWRIEDPLNYFKSVGNRVSAESKLDALILAQFGEAFGKREFSRLVNVEPDRMKLNDIVQSVLEKCRQQASAEYGIALTDLCLKRLAFPTQVRQSVLNRIRSERQARSAEIRSEGEADATRIRAQADLDSARILAEARRQATLLRGQGEAEAAAIWREALEDNIDFYEFQKRLELYEKGFNKDTVLFVPAESPLMRLLLQGPEDSGQSGEKTQGQQNK